MKDHQRKSSDKDIDGEGMLGGMYYVKKMYSSINIRSIA
jgi:hypothetical protein